MTTSFESLYKDYSNRHIQQIDSFINNFFDNKIKTAKESFMKDMYGDLKEYCTRDGKRVRPLLLTLAYNGYNNGINRNSEIVKLSAVIEMMHSFLLIQDDIIDKSELRRGGKALHISSKEKYSSTTFNKDIGRDIAIVLADVLFSNSIEIISNAKISNKIRKTFLKIFSQTYEMTAWGQILDCIYSQPQDINLKDNIPEKVSTLKTAYYTIYYPMLMGYTLTGRKNSSEIKHIEDFALPLGIAFQIRDDILGAFGKSSDIGKPDDSDILEGKLTLLIQSTMESLQSNEQKEFISLLNKKDKNKSNIETIREQIIKSGALEKTKARHKNLISEAEKNLSALKLKKKSKHILNGLIGKISII